VSVGKRLLWFALLLTVVAALWPVPEGDNADAPASRPSALRHRAPVPDSSPAQQLRSLTGTDSVPEREIVDLFPRQGWTAPAVSAVPDKPTAPALPFTYGGRYTEGGNVFVFLNEGARMHKVRQGDTVNATYRIDTIAAGAITLTYLPLGMQQTIQTGSPSPQ
jgi:hypothetical protein